MRNIKTLAVVSLAIAISFPLLSHAAGNAQAGKSKAALCGGCHGAEGISVSPEVPNLKGQKAAYLIKAVKDYKTGARKNPMMAPMVAALSDQDIADIAAYFSSL